MIGLGKWPGKEYSYISEKLAKEGKDVSAKYVRDMHQRVKKMANEGFKDEQIMAHFTLGEEALTLEIGKEGATK